MLGTFQCTVVTPTAPVLDQAVRHATVPAWDGWIGLLPLRAPLLVKLGYGPLRLDLPDNTTQVLFVGGGFAQMKDDMLTVLTDEAIPPEQIDRAEAEDVLKEAYAIPATADQDAAGRRRNIDRALAMVAMTQRGS